jgi:hypothetical protein
MCTVTWWLAPAGASYEVFFNRDERRTRGAATPPVQADAAGVKYLAPADADFGGTWLLVNAHGVVLALINHYPANPKTPLAPARSRGLLLRDLADCAGITAVCERLAEAELARFNAFFLLAFEPGQKPRKWTWDTRTLLEDSAADPLPFFTSSSFRSEDIRRHRRKLFVDRWAAKGPLTPDDLAQFHLLREPERPAFGLLMDRADARTVSYSHILVRPGSEAIFAYSPRPAADGGPPASPQVARLPLTAP